MKKLIAMLLVVPLVAWIALASDHKRTSASGITVNDDELSDNCADHLHMYNDDFRSYVRDEETRSLPNQPLTITAEGNGGIEVSTWEQPEFSIKLCKQVATNDEAEGHRLLSQTRLAVNGGLSISLPERWEGKGLEARAHNGGLVVAVPKNFSGGLE